MRPILFLFLLLIVRFILPTHQVRAQDPTEPVPGETVMRTAAGETSVTYHVYTPENYTSGETRPVLILFSPGGSGKGILSKIKDGTANAGWIVVGCDSLRNNFNDHRLAVQMEDEILEDVYKTLPVDRERVYLGGFSGGAWRAYHITARRKEKFAGILAYGGWLGGSNMQDRPYCEHMSVAMINGVRDMGANAWWAMDTESLKKRNCTVKHFRADKGHGIASPEVTETVIDWMEKEWQRKLSGAQEERISLDVLYVGGDPDRTSDFESFLSRHFRSVEATAAADLTLEKVNRADVLLLDTVVRSLLDGCTKAMLLTGPPAALTGERYGSRIKSKGNYSGMAATGLKLDHEVFQGPLPLRPQLIDSPFPLPGELEKVWMLDQETAPPGMIAKIEGYEELDDSRVIAYGLSPNGEHGPVLLREAHRFFWGFSGSPSEMTQDGQHLLVNSLAWIHQFDGNWQTIYAGLTERKEISVILEDPEIADADLHRWFPREILDRYKYKRKKILKYYSEQIGYVHVPYGSGLLHIDEDAKLLGTPNNETASLEKWIGMLKGDQKSRHRHSS